MENNSMPENPDDPRAALAAADQARQRLTTALRLPAGLHPVLAVTVAIQIGTAAYGAATHTAAGLAVALAGVAVFLSVAASTLHRFRRINGVRVDGLASQIVLGTAAESTLVYLGAFAAATWAGFASRWWLLATIAVIGGAGYAYSLHRWWRAYRHDPAAHTGGASPRTLAALAALTCLGLVALLVAG
jgi:hypothetical protein